MKDLGDSLTSRSSSIVECQALFEADNNQFLQTDQKKTGTHEDGPREIHRRTRNNSKKKEARVTNEEERAKMQASLDKYCQEQIDLHKRNQMESFNRNQR